MGHKAQSGAGRLAVAQIILTGICKISVTQSGRAVTHQHQNGLAAQQTCRRIVHGHRVALCQKLIQRTQNALLDVGRTGDLLSLRGRLLGAIFVNHICVDADVLTASGAVGQIQPICAGGVPTQRKQGDGGVAVGRAGAGAGIEHHADPVVLVCPQQGGNAGVGSLHQFLCHIVIAGIHRAADIQDQHRVRRHIGHTHNAHIGRHGGKGNQKALLVVLCDACKGTFRQNGLIQPNTACILGVQLAVQTKIILVPIQGRRVCHLGDDLLCLNFGRSLHSGNRKHGQHHGQHKEQTCQPAAQGFFVCHRTFLLLFMKTVKAPSPARQGSLAR